MLRSEWCVLHVENNVRDEGNGMNARDLPHIQQKGSS